MKYNIFSICNLQILTGFRLGRRIQIQGGFEDSVDVSLRHVVRVFGGLIVQGMICLLDYMCYLKCEQTLIGWAVLTPNLLCYIYSFYIYPGETFH